MKLPKKQRDELRDPARGDTKVLRRIRKPPWWEGHTICAGVYDPDPPYTKRGYWQILCSRDGGEQRFPPLRPGREVRVGRLRCIVGDVMVVGSEEMLTCDTDAVPAFWEIELCRCKAKEESR